MQQDESTLVKQALQDAREQLARVGHAMPAAYMLVRNNPQTGAPLSHPTAVGLQRDRAFQSSNEYDEFLESLRAEARRLDATAVALAGEAEAEVEAASGPARRRVLYVRVEDAQGVAQLHAAIERDTSGALTLGPLFEAADVADLIDSPLLSKP